jgi:GT2 family glycosyltransferase
MGGLNVVIPTAGTKRLVDAVKSLSNIPMPIHLHLMTGYTYEEGINAGVLESAGNDGDFLLMDDDVRLRPETFTDMHTYYDDADIFGYQLRFENNSIQHAGVQYIYGGFQNIGYMDEPKKEYDEFKRVVAVTGALLYVKRHVMDDLKGLYTKAKGKQYMDVEFCLRAFEKGYKILYVPRIADHYEEFRKNEDDAYVALTQKNYEWIREQYVTKNEKEYLSYPKAL